VQTLIAKDPNGCDEHHAREGVEQRTDAKSSISWISGECAIREVVGKIQQVARCNLPVLLCGESGTGKELCACHPRYSPRKAKPYIRLNALPCRSGVGIRDLATSGLLHRRCGMPRAALRCRWGHPLSGRIGRSASFQAKLLRVLQEGEFERVAGNRTIKVDGDWCCDNGIWSGCAVRESDRTSPIGSAWCRSFLPLCGNGARLGLLASEFSSLQQRAWRFG